jgi:hypothetical protein
VPGAGRAICFLIKDIRQLLHNGYGSRHISLLAESFIFEPKMTLAHESFRYRRAMQSSGKSQSIIVTDFGLYLGYRSQEQLNERLSARNVDVVISNSMLA